MNKIYFTFALFAIFSISLFSQNHPEITDKEVYEHIHFLSSDDLKGRLTGSDEIYEAAKYIENEFTDYGLKPLFGDSYFQSFNFISGVELGDNNSLIIRAGNDKTELEPTKDFYPLSFSGSASFNTEVVFAGFGISAPNDKYDDYAGIDVKGKTVIVFRNYPGLKNYFSLKNDPDFKNLKSKFAKYSSIRQKAKIAKDKGAIGLIVVNGYEEVGNVVDDNFIPFIKEDQAPMMKDFPVIQLKRSIIEQIFIAKGNTLENLFNMISTTLQPSSLVLDGFTLSLETDVRMTEGLCRNVAGYIEGSDPILKNEYIVVGAHYDHLGSGEFSSLSKVKEPQIHNGADDNASGTAGVLELAEKFAANRELNKRSVIFVCFSGEELGLLGSSYFVNNSPISLTSVAAMFNLDMVGRLDSAKSLVIYGTGTSAIWKDLIPKHNTEFKLSLVDDGFGASDHSSFYGKSIPVLFFSTGVHGDYHRPTDDIEFINSNGEKEILDLVYSIASDVTNLESKPDYLATQKKESTMNGGWKVYVGTVPDFSSSEEGFKISAVNDGSPAQKGGIKSGDLMIKFGDKNITNIYDYVYALQEHVPGDVVEVIVKRNNEIIKLKLELGMK